MYDPETPRSDEPEAGWGDQVWGDQAAAGPPTRPASVGKRAGAYLIDIVGLSMVTTVLAVLFGVGLDVVAGLESGGVFGATYRWQAVSALITLAYFALLEGSTGQTLAKRLLGIKVVMDDGSPATLQSAVVRRVPFVIGTFLPVIGFFVGFGLLLAILVTAIQDESKHRGIHDRWAGTTVVDTP